MAELKDRDPIWVKNLNTDVKTTIAFYKTKDSRYMKRCNLQIIDERIIGAEIIQPPVVTKSPEQRVAELKNEFGIDVIEEQTTEETPQELRKRLFAEADERGIVVPKNIKTELLIEKLK